MNANTDDLVRWLGVQLDEDERIARSTHPVFLAWEYDRSVREVRDLGNGNELVHGVEPRYGEHIVAHDPARVLREIDAKRQILSLHQEKQEQGYGSDLCAECGFGEVSQSYYPCATLRLLALPYADRPGYRAEWRP